MDEHIRQHWKEMCVINDDDVNLDNFRICEDHFQDAVFLTARQLLESTTTHDVVLREVDNPDLHYSSRIVFRTRLLSSHCYRK
jgi:hypothetical protein